MLARIAIALLILIVPAAAQDARQAPAQLGVSPLPVPTPVVPVPDKIIPILPEPNTPKTPVTFKGQFGDGGPDVTAGVVWRVFSVRNDEAGELPLLAETTETDPTIPLEPGSYVVNAAYGLATTTRRIDVAEVPKTEAFVIKAGGLQISAKINDKVLPDDEIFSRITAVAPTGERRLVADNIPATNIVRLPAGQYFVECSYGDSNALTSADVTIFAGKLTEARFKQYAATLTFKLVSTAGGEAIADTSWSILTPGGDVVRESIGAFPRMVLAAGTYSVVARHDGRVYTREFEVKTGADQDIEVPTK